MDIHSMDGHEFERLITQLMKNMGFSVEMTSLSGDGGIDIIAYSNDPIIKGRYLVQCKRWDATIGEPTVRDLYGVVLSENANKGIIITNSNFSNKAVAFADGKNIELIDGTLLAELLEQHDITTNLTNFSNKKRFDEMEGFDKEKYMYLKSRVESNRNEKQHYDLLREFYHSYVINNKFEINKAGLLDEYVKFNYEIIQRFCKRTKIQLKEKEAIQIINGMLYLLKGEIFKSVEIYRDLSLFKEYNFENMLLHRYSTTGHYSNQEEDEIVETIKYVRHQMPTTSVVVREKNTEPSPILMNLYLLFFHLEFIDGVQYFESTIENHYKDVRESDFNMDLIYLWRTHTLKDIQSFINDVKDQKHKRIYLPLKYTLHKLGSEIYMPFYFNEDTYITVDQLQNKYWNKEIPVNEVKMLEVLFR